MGCFMPFVCSAGATSSMAPSSLVKIVIATECFLWVSFPCENRSWGWVSKPYWSYGGSPHQRGPWDVRPFLLRCLIPLNSQNILGSFRIYRTWNWRWVLNHFIFKGQKDPRQHLGYNYSNPNHDGEASPQSSLLRWNPLQRLSLRYF